MKAFLLIFLLAACSIVSAQSETKSLINGSVAIQARGWWLNGFEVSERGGAVVGRFRAEGGSNDIYCHVMDADQYENFKNGNEFVTFYSSGRVTVANLNVRLPAGIYFLVFSNRHAVATPKTIYGTIELRR